VPELPEVETVVRGLAGLAGRRLREFRLHWPKTLAAPETEFRAAFVGRTVAAVFRRGKYICLEFRNGPVCTVHLRMSGRLLFQHPAEGDKHLRAEFHFSPKLSLFFVDPRKFGRIESWPGRDALLPGLGVEPLTAEAVGAALERRTARAVKAVLLDQSILAGVGNIYADEALFRAAIHPTTPLSALSPVQRRELATVIPELLQEAIAHMGTTLTDYRTPEDARGGHGEFLQVYGRTGRPCRNCGTPVERMIVAGRSSHFCRRCQPAPLTPSSSATDR